MDTLSPARIVALQCTDGVAACRQLQDGVSACPSQCHPHNYFEGDTQPSVTPNGAIQPVVVAPNVSNGKKPKDVSVPDDLDDDEPDPDAGPSGHNNPSVLPIDGNEQFNPAPIPENDPIPDSPDGPESPEE